MKQFLFLIIVSVFDFQITYAQSGIPDTPFIINSTVAILSESGSSSTLPDVKYHLTARPWQALNISRNEYLNKVEGVVREIAKLQNSGGAIIDPYADRELQYSTPYFAYAVGTLLSAGKAIDLLSKGVAAMNSATADVAAGKSYIPDNHGEFFLAPLSSAILLYTPFVTSSQLTMWKERMAQPVANVIQGLTHNWRTYAMKGEWYRAKNGYVNKATALTWLENSWITTQKDRFINNSWNFYHDNTSNPDTWPYESAARSNLLSMIAEGYSGASRNDMLGILKKASQSSLLLQDPSGQAIAGGRSGNHTWNDIVLANGYETMAEIAFQEGNTRLAGQYRHAAALAFKSAQRWKMATGAYYVTKNSFNPGSRIRYASHSFFTNYNGYMMYHMAENYLQHKTAITEQAAPNEIGGYTIVSDESLATAVANAGGMHMEVCLRGSETLAKGLYWTTLGAVRFGRPGWDSRLGPSDGVRETLSKLGVSFAPTFLENGNWIRLASVPDRYEAFFTTQFTHPLLVRCRVVYQPKSGKTGPTFTNNFVITPDAILSTISSTSSNFGVTWPILTFDGLTNLTTGITSHVASTSYPGAADQQNFIALHSSPAIIATDSTRRSSYGDLRPVRMVSGSTSNVTLIYPRNSTDPSAEAVRKSYTGSANNFSTILGKVNGNTYVGRTSAGGVGTSIDINNDSIADVTFNTTTGFLMQLQTGKIIKIETDRDVTAKIQGQTFNLQAYTPAATDNLLKVGITKVTSSADNGNVAMNTIDGNSATRWAAEGDHWIKYYLDTITAVKSIKIAWYNGDQRKASFDIQTSLDGSTWTTVFSGTSSGTTSGFESYNITPATARYVRIVGHGNNLNNWNSITELEILKTNLPPVVSITSPANNATFTAPANVLVTATANDADGSVSNVKFYNGATFLKTESTAPYTCNMSNLPAGTYSLKAKATDNLGGETFSSVKIFTVKNAALMSAIINSSDGSFNDSNTEAITLSPNPANNILNIYTTGWQVKQATVAVISAVGVLTETRTIALNQVVQLPVSSLAAGIYTIKLIIGDKVRYRKFVKL